eukprot:742143-Amphidinium_carterae.1
MAGPSVHDAHEQQQVAVQRLDSLHHGLTARESPNPLAPMVSHEHRNQLTIQSKRKIVRHGLYFYPIPVFKNEGLK